MGEIIDVEAENASVDDALRACRSVHRVRRFVCSTEKLWLHSRAQSRGVAAEGGGAG